MKFDPVHNKSQRRSYYSFLTPEGTEAADAAYAAYIADLDAQAAASPLPAVTSKPLGVTINRCRDCGAAGHTDSRGLGIDCGCAAE